MTTVKDLVDRLKTVPPDTPILRGNDASGYDIFEVWWFVKRSLFQSKGGFSDASYLYESDEQPVLCLVWEGR